MEASGITATQKSTAGSEQGESDVDLFFDSCGIVHHEYAPEGQTINKEYHLEVLRRLRAAVHKTKKWPDMWRAKNFQLHHDNAPAYSAHVIQDFLAKNGMPLVRQAPYTPDLAPCDFWLFPTLKTTLKGKRFSVTGGHHTKNLGGAKEHSGGAIPEDFPEVAEALGKVC